MVTSEDCRRATYALFQARDILKGSPCCGDCTRCNLNIKVWGPNRACIANVVDFAADDLLEKAQEGENIPLSAVPGQKTDQEIMDLTCSIIDVFEEALEEKNITVHSNDRTGDPDEARLFGTEYYTVYDEIEAIIRKELNQEEQG